LVSGVAPFEEQSQVWNDHFINVWELRVGHLPAKTAVELLMSPESSFPTDTIPQNLAEQIFGRTRGQPYLVQLYG